MCTSDMYRRSGTRPPGRGCFLRVNEHHTQTLVTSSASKAPRLTQGIWWLPFFDTENERVRPGVTRFWDLTALGSSLSIMLEPLRISCVLGRRSAAEKDPPAVRVTACQRGPGFIPSGSGWHPSVPFHAHCEWPCTVLQVTFTDGQESVANQKVVLTKEGKKSDE